MGIKVQKATQDALTFIAESLLKSARAEKSVSIFEHIFESTDDSVIIKNIEKLLTSETKSYIHLSNFLIAYDNDKLAGVLCAYESKLDHNDSLSKALSEIDIDANYTERLAAYLMCKPQYSKNALVLDFIDVQDDFNELSVIKELIQKALLSARLKGYRKAYTAIEIGSAETEMIYKKFDFSFESEKRSDFYMEIYSRLGIMLYSVEL